MLDILDHYRSDDIKPNDLIFPLLKKNYKDPIILKKAISSKNALVNNLLKKLATKAEIESSISFHASRHSWVHFALKLGMDLYSISKALGHGDLKITEEYIKTSDKKMLDQSMENIYS